MPLTLNWPTSLDALSNPDATTNCDDTGFNLDEVIARIHDFIELAEAKLGTGSTTPSTNTVLRSGATGVGTWGPVQTLDIVANAITQRTASVIGFTGTRTATGFADVDSTNGKATLTTVGGDLLAFFWGSATNSVGNVIQVVSTRLDAGADSYTQPCYGYTGLANFPVPFGIVALYTGVSGTVASPVSHTVFARHNNGSAIGTMTTTGTIILLEFKK